MVAKHQLPPKPQALSDRESLYQSTAACVDLVTTRLPAASVYQALASARKDAYWAAYEQWKKSGHHEQCAMIVTSRSEDFVARMCGLFGQEALASCIEDRIDSCISQAMQNCQAPLAAWRNEVAQIENEPNQLHAQCEQSLNVIAQAEKRIPQLEMESSLNADEHNRLTAGLPDGKLRAQLAHVQCR
jgi:hypothetical protein